MSALNFLKKFRHKQDGNVAITAAMSLPVVLMIGFGAMDYGIMVQSDQELKSAAAAASLAAVNEAQIAYTNEEGEDLKELMEQTAKKVFNARVEKMNLVDVSSIEVTSKVDGNRLSANLSYRATYKTQVIGVAGMKSINIANSQRATISSASYSDITFVIDSSGSMGIGSTVADQQLMMNTIGCTFGCHNNQVSANSSYGRAKAAGATMRIDVAKNAAMKSLDIIRDNTELDDQIRLGLYRYSSNLTPVMNASDANSSDLNHVRNVFDDEIHLDFWGMGSNTELALEKVAERLPDGGSGRTPNDRKQYIVVVTDAVDDWRHFYGTPSGSERLWSRVNLPRYGGGVWAPGNTGCKAIRDRGINIYFIQTEYLAPTIGQHQAYYRWIDANLNPIIPDRLAACTGSADNVISTVTPGELDNAMSSVIGDISSPLRLY